MNYATLLNQHQLKATPQRLEIVKLLNQYGHISIDNLYNMMQNRFPSLSLATIYKNIHKMCDTFFVSEVKIPNNKSVYELTKSEHAHIVCTQCHNIIDINLDISSIVTQATTNTHYSIDSSSVVLNGLCPKCQNK